jgi:hypothetical protein
MATPAEHATEFQKRILPAKLTLDGAAGHLNGQLIAVWINANRNGISSVDNMVDATKAIYASLSWDVPPAVLVRDREAQKIIKVEPASVGAEKRAKIEKEAAALAARKKSDEANMKAARSAVASYLPVNKRGQVEHGKLGEVQKILNDYLDRQPANVDTADVLAKVLKYLADKYQEAEKAAERVS